MLSQKKSVSPPPTSHSYSGAAMGSMPLSAPAAAQEPMQSVQKRNPRPEFWGRPPGDAYDTNRIGTELKNALRDVIFASDVSGCRVRDRALSRCGLGGRFSSLLVVDDMRPKLGDWPRVETVTDGEVRRRRVGGGTASLERSRGGRLRRGRMLEHLATVH